MSALFRRLGTISRIRRAARTGARAAYARHAAPVLLLVLVAASALMLHDLDSDPPGASRPTTRAPDFFAESFATTVLDERGRPRRRLEARYMAHYLDTDTQELVRPYLVMYREGEAPWHVRSERGRRSANEGSILMTGEVFLWREGPEGERHFEVRTRDLRVVPDEDYGETERPVVMTTRHSRSRGVGMRAFLDERRLELLSRAQTVYERDAFLP